MSSFWSLDGYLHRYYLLQDPLISSGDGLKKQIQTEANSFVKKEIAKIRKMENDKLKSFSSGLGYDKMTNSEAFKIADKILSTGNPGIKNIFESIVNQDLFKWKNDGEIKSSNFIPKEYRGQIIEAAGDGMINVLTNKVNNTSSLSSQKKNIEKKYNKLWENSINQLLSSGIKAPMVGTAIGDLVEVWETVSISKAIYDELNKNGKEVKAKLLGDLSSNIQEISISSSKNFTVKRTGNLRIGTSMGSKRLSPADIVISIDGKDCLPIQIKTKVQDNYKNIGLLRGASFSELLNNTKSNLIKRYILFALIHQNAFSNKRYQDLIKQSYLETVKGINGEEKYYTFGSDTTAFIRLDKSSMIPQLTDAVDIMKIMASVSLIRGTTETNKNLFYLFAKGATGETKLRRVSDMIKSVLENTDRIEVYGAKGSSYPKGLTKDKYNSIITREEWARFITPLTRGALDKAKASFSFNYANLK